jgi:hypothetical protein
MHGSSCCRGCVAHAEEAELERQSLARYQQALAELEVANQRLKIAQQNLQRSEEALEQTLQAGQAALQDSIRRQQHQAAAEAALERRASYDAVRCSPPGVWRCVHAMACRQGLSYVPGCDGRHAKRRPD